MEYIVKDEQDLKFDKLRESVRTKVKDGAVIKIRVPGGNRFVIGEVRAFIRNVARVRKLRASIKLTENELLTCTIGAKDV